MSRRERSLTRLKRWPSDLGIAALNTLVLRILFPTAAIGVAMLSEERGWGLLNAVIVPEWAAVLIAVMVLDLAIYFQHVLFHAVPSLFQTIFGPVVFYLTHLWSPLFTVYNLPLEVSGGIKPFHFQWLRGEAFLIRHSAASSEVLKALFRLAGFQPGLPPPQGARN